jgi:hypothetical protein
MFQKIISATIIILCLGSISCYEINDPCGAADDFFPLRVGDKFLYKLSPESKFGGFTRKEEVEVNVTRQVDTLGKKYYVIENFFLVGTGYEGIIYARKDGHNVYFFAPDKEVLYYNFDPSDDKVYFIPEGINPFGEWPFGGNEEDFVIEKTDVGNNQMTFLVKGRFFAHLKIYSKFERGKGLIQVISQGDLGTVIYDLVEVYR